MAKKPSKIRRFPRYHSGSQAVALANFWQTQAQFEIQLDSDTRSLVFKYRYQIPAKIPPDCGSLYDSLFSVYRIDLEKQLRDALQSLRSGRPALDYINKFHHRAIREGILGWLRGVYDNPSVPLETKQEQIRRYDALPTKHSGPDAQLALSVWARVEEVLALVKHLRKTIKLNLLTRTDEKALVNEIEKNGLRLEDVRAALRSLSGDQNWNSVKAFFDKSFGSTAMAHSIVQSELAPRISTALGISVRTYVRRAKQLLEALRDREKSTVLTDKEA